MRDPDAATPGAPTRSGRRRAGVAAASLAIHGVLLWLVLTISQTAVVEEPRSALPPIDIEVVVRPPPAAPEPPTAVAAVSRPGASGTPVRTRSMERAGLRGQHGHATLSPTPAPPVVDPFADLEVRYDTGDPSAPHPGSGTGNENLGPGPGPGNAARGDGRGLGIAAALGPGGGGALRVPPAPPVLPSLARPPRAKHDYRRWSFRAPRELGDSKILLELSIDAHGEVADVRVLSGVGGRVDQRAMDVARRFEFYPALDSAGRPTAGIHHWEFVIEGEIDFHAVMR
jgi:outer membrane biosynthesis protein TonB